MTKSAKDYLKSEIDRLVTQAGSITSIASAENRSLEAREKSTVEGLLATAQEYKQRIKEMDENDQINEQIEAMRRARSPEAEHVSGPKKADSNTWGGAFTNSKAFQSLQAAFKSGALTGNWSSGPVEMPSFFDGKAVPAGALTTDAYPFSEAGADVRPGIQSILQRPITITDLLGQGTTDSSVIRYVQETLFTNGAATVPEGELKPASALAFDNVDEPVRKIATFLPITDEMLEDAAQMRSYLDGRLRLGVQLTEETQLLSGDGTGSNIRGLLNRTGLQTITAAAPATGVTNPSIAEYLYSAITNVRVNALVEPDAIVMHPTNYAALRLAKDSGGEFNAGGPFGGLAGNTVWGLPVALSLALPVNTAVVGAFRSQAQVFRRNGLTVEASNSHADFFQRNMTAIRAELRVGLAVYRPSAFVRVAGLQYAGVRG